MSSAEPVSNFAVRRLRESDLGAVLAIEAASFSMPWSRHSFRNLLGRSDADLWAAVTVSSLVGYAVVWYAGEDAELGNLAVAPEWRRRGLGRMLLDRVIESVLDRGSLRLFLEVRRSNTAAQALYEEYGFKPAGLRRRYYRAPVEDATVMCLDVSVPERATSRPLGQSPR